MEWGAFPLDVTPRADGLLSIMHDGAYKMSRTEESRGEWSRVYLSRINYVRASKTIEKRWEMKAGEEYYATNLMNREYQYNGRSGVVLRRH